MKLLTISLLASLALAANSFAGHEMMMSSGKDKKEMVPPTCFNDKELQVDLFGAYAVGNGNSHAGNFRDHGFGGGLGINYFFNRYLGVGAEYTAFDARKNSDEPGVRGHNPETFQQEAGGSLIFRLPIDRLCLAPYGYVGGANVFSSKDFATVFAGAGVEYRIVPNKIGLFVDERWSYQGDRFGDGDQNFFTTRAGVRWVF